MIPVKFEIRERGATPRKLLRATNKAIRESWFETGLHFHREMSDDRFTHRHATLAGYQKRSRNYERTKLKKFGHTNPLEFTGRTRRLSRNANIVATNRDGGSGVEVRYGGLNTLNFRNPKARNPIDMASEFRRINESERTTLASVFDRALDHRLAAFQESTSTTVS